MAEERRQHQRVVPNAPLFISLDESKSGLLLDLSEGGLAVASLVPRNIDDVVSLAFDLPEGEGRIEAKARIAWTRDSGHLTGVHFVELGEQSQRQLNDWISAGMNLRMAVTQEPPEPIFVTRSSYVEVDSIAQLPRAVWAASAPPAATMLSRTNLEPEAFEVIAPPEPEPSKPGKSRYTMELVLAVVLLSWALVFLGYQMGSTGASRQTHEVTAASKVAETSPGGDLANAAALPRPTPVAAPGTARASSAKSIATPKVASAATPASKPMSSVPTRASASGPEPQPMRTVVSVDSGVILQVGAMKLEDNAAALAQDLRKRNFPTVVFRRGNEKLYKVAVGPYGDADTSGKIKEQLEKQGFKALVQRWARD